MKRKQVPATALIASPANFMALGAGLGLAPVAPGTFGTLLGIPLLYLMPQSVSTYLLVLVLLFGIGVWSCDSCTRSLGFDDHPAIVWDEVVGYLIAMLAMPRTMGWVVAAFLVFRIFDILKPWPIRLLDRRLHGGIGIMLDDALAGVFSLIVLQLAHRFLGW